MSILSILASREVAPPPTMLRAADLGELDEVIYEGTDSYSRPVDVDRRLRWLASSAEHHLDANPAFARLARHAGFSTERLLDSGDASCIPLISSGTFKRRK